MNITIDKTTIEITTEQLAVINKKADTASFLYALTASVTGIIAWYTDEGRQIIEAEEKVETIARSVLIDKLEPVKLAQVDAIIGYVKTVEPIAK